MTTKQKIDEKTDEREIPLTKFSFYIKIMCGAQTATDVTVLLARVV